MNLVFISNIDFTKSEITGYSTDNAIAVKGKSIGDIHELLTKIKQDGSNIFIIDVHCCFNEKQKMQDQGGVMIYRYLLNEYKHNQDKLKVVFYSPVSQNGLVAISRGENYVLKLLPFIECQHDGQFEEKLITEINKYTASGFPIFNNASENLLSGWSLNGENKVEVKKKKIVFVDDQADEWSRTFEKIFRLGKEGAKVPEIFLYNKNKISDKEFSLEKLDKTFAEKVKETDLIITDFYLEEDHQSNKWMSTDELSGKSGFLLFQAIKGTKNTTGIHKGVPVVMHTSSNKIQYYQFLDANGVDNWLVKDIRPNTSKEEKKENFHAFKTVIEQFTFEKSARLYSTLKEFWTKIEGIEKNKKTNWWYGHTDIIDHNVTPLKTNIDSKKYVILILKDCWLSLRADLNKEEYFVENIGSINKNFIAASICNNLGKLLEVFKFNQRNDYNYFFKFLYSIRNAASHYNDYNQFDKWDCVIYMQLWLTILDTDVTDHTDFFGKNDPKTEENIIQEDKESERAFKYGLLYAYIQYYNCTYSKRYLQIKEDIKNRMNVLFDKSDKTDLLNEVLKNNGITIPGPGGRRTKHLKQAVARDISNSTNPIQLDKFDDDKLLLTNG